MTVSLTTGGLRPVMKRGSVVFEGARGAVVLRYGGLVATDVRGVGFRSWLALQGGRVQIRIDDRGARYPVRIDPFVQQGSKLLGPGASGGAFCCGS